MVGFQKSIQSGKGIRNWLHYSFVFCFLWGLIQVTHFVFFLFLFIKGCWRWSDSWKKNISLVSVRCKEEAYFSHINSHVILLAFNFDFQCEELHCIFLLEKSFTFLFLFRNHWTATMFIKMGRKFLFWQVCSRLLNGTLGLTVFVL